MRSTILLILELLILAGAGLAGLIVESEITTTGSFQNAPVIENYAKSTIKVEGDRYRIDVEIKGPPGAPLTTSTIVNRGDGTVIKLFHSSKTFDKVSQEELEESNASARQRLERQGLLPSSRPIPEATGREDIINGYEVEEYTFYRDEGNARVKGTFWVAISLQEHVDIIAKAVDPASAVMNLQFPDLSALPGLPVRTEFVQDAPAGQFHTIANLLSVDVSPISEEDFQVPDGYVEK